MEGAVGTVIQNQIMICGGIELDLCFIYDSVADGWLFGPGMNSDGRSFSAAAWIDSDKWWITGTAQWFDFLMASSLTFENYAFSYLI